MLQMQLLGLMRTRNALQLDSRGWSHLRRSATHDFKLGRGKELRWDATDCNIARIVAKAIEIWFQRRKGEVVGSTMMRRFGSGNAK